MRGSSWTKKPGETGESEPVGHQGSLHFTEGHLTGSAEIEKGEEEGRSFWTLNGVVSTRPGATGASVCVVTICYDDPQDRDWAVETWKSVYRGPGEAEK